MTHLHINNAMVSKKNKGFTLIELSIVMVIIGLIIGGILTGQELIHGAGVRATMSQIIKYNSAVNTFQMKYSALPGDFLTAADYIVGAANGDGNGLIGSATGGPATPGAASAATEATVVASQEYSNFWSHLSALGLIEGSYAVVASAAPSTALATGANYPATRMNSGAGILAYGNVADNSNYYHLGVTAVSAAQAVSNSDFLSPSDAFAIDTKMDDGLPASGIVAARGNNAGAGGLELAASFVATLGGTPTGCVVGASYAASTAYNTGAATSSSLCELRIRIN